MRAILEFDLPEEERLFREAMDGSKWKYVVWQIDEHLRRELKYNESLPKEAYKSLEQTRTTLHQFINQDNLDLS